MSGKFERKFEVCIPGDHATIRALHATRLWFSSANRSGDDAMIDEQRFLYRADLGDEEDDVVEDEEFLEEEFEDDFEDDDFEDDDFFDEDEEDFEDEDDDFYEDEDDFYDDDDE
jgi:hypothetical protein